MKGLLILFLVVLVLNVIPAFAPPTWMVFSFLGFRYADHMGWVLALTGALAATLGRFLLAKISRTIIRKRWLSQSSRENVDAVRQAMEKHPRATFGAFLFYAFTPLPSNYVFIAYGLTTLSMLRIVVPFFLGRFVSYSFWTMSAAALSRKINLEDTESLRYFSVYYVLTQCLLLAVVYGFAKIDWGALQRERKLQWTKKARNRA